MEDFEEISQFLLGRNATNNEIKNDCDCDCGECYCVCCKNWGLVLLLFLILAGGYIGGSFFIAYKLRMLDDDK